MTRRVYRNPPIEEALCEFRFASSEEWDPTLSVKFHEKVKKTYSGKPQERTSIEARVSTSNEAPRPSVEIKQELDRIQYPNENGTESVGVGRDVLSVHVLRPYLGWEIFSQRIESALSAYIETAHPKGITRLGLRYINKLEIPVEGPIELKDYFSAAPSLPEKLPTNMSNFLTRIESIYQDAPIQLILTFGTTTAPKDRYGFLLDLDMICVWPNEPLPCKQIMEVVRDVREKERDAFEAFIEDAARRLFDAK